MTDARSALRFDRAEYEEGSAAGPPCSVCKGPLGAEYWRWQGLVFCSRCKSPVEAKIADGQSHRAFAKAALQGTGVALACGVGYAVFVGLTKMQLALVTIGIAYVVARVVRKASGGLGGTRFQVLAVALTYVASTMGYAPSLLAGLQEGGEIRAAHAPIAAGAEIERSAATDDEARPSGAAANGTETADAPSAAGDGEHVGPIVSALRLAYGIAFLLGIMLAAPFLELSSAPLGVVIILIGLWQAWKLTRGVPTTIMGPYRVAPATPGPTLPAAPAVPSASELDKTP
jgi:hypothetical protein